MMDVYEINHISTSTIPHSNKELIIETVNSMKTAYFLKG